MIILFLVLCVMIAIGVRWGELSRNEIIGVLVPALVALYFCVTTRELWVMYTCGLTWIVLMAFVALKLGL